MNRKILCRIISNIYHVYDDATPLNDEIDSLRSSGNSSNNTLNELLELHKEIIKENGNLDFFDLSKKIEGIFYNEFTILKKDFIDVMYLYYREKIFEVPKAVLSKKNILNRKYLFIYLAILLNTMQYRKTKEMFVYHPNDLFSFGNEVDSKRVIANAKLETEKYLMKKRSFSIDEIKSFILHFFNENKEYVKLIKKVYLFGSYAKGKNDDSSDVDLFFEVKNKQDISLLFEPTIKNYMKEQYDMELDVALHFDGDEYDSFDNKILSYAIELM